MDKKESNEKPVTVNITNHNTFEKGVGAFITNLNHLTIMMDGEGNIKMDAASVPVLPHTEMESVPNGETDEDEDEDKIGTRIKNALDVLQEENLLKHLYDYTWVMEAMNQTNGMPNFNTPSSFIAYIKDVGVEKLPSEDSILLKRNNFVGDFPNWEFEDCDTREAKRRINVGKRFLNAYRSK